MAKNYWEGKNIRLRALEENDIACLVEQRNAQNHEAYWCYDKIYLPEHENGMTKIFEEIMAAQKKDDKFYFVIDSLDDDFIGHVYIWHTQSRERMFRYGIMLHEEHQGKGYAAEALVIVLDYYFNELNYNKCAPTVYNYNKASQAFHEKLGFIREGELRNEIYSRGEYHGLVCYGMMKNEFNKRYKHF